MKVDYLVIGSGITGATIARLLADSGREVLVLERRAHVGGNVHDEEHASGIRIHSHGPHYFRTGSDRIWEFARRFGSFYPFEPVVMSSVSGRYEHWPVLKTFIDRVAGPNWKPSWQGTPSNFEEACLSMMPRVIYESFIEGYTAKQWGMEPKLLDAKLAGRFEVRMDHEIRLCRHKYQGIPTGGYHAWMKALLHGVTTKSDCDYLDHREDFHAHKLLIFTGPIDEYFGFKLGRLRYRAQKRKHYFDGSVSLRQPCVQVNNPAPTNGNHIRTIEWKHMLPPAIASQVKGTVLTTEEPYTPQDPDQYEYPFPDLPNQELFTRYAAQASILEKVLICGRLGEYRYYDMDQAMGRAMKIASQILAGTEPRPQ